MRSLGMDTPRQYQSIRGFFRFAGLNFLSRIWKNESYEYYQDIDISGVLGLGFTEYPVISTVSITTSRDYASFKSAERE